MIIIIIMNEETKHTLYTLLLQMSASKKPVEVEQELAKIHVNRALMVETLCEFILFPDQDQIFQDYVISYLHSYIRKALAM